GMDRRAVPKDHPREESGYDRARRAPVRLDLYGRGPLRGASDRDILAASIHWVEFGMWRGRDILERRTNKFLEVTRGKFRLELRADVHPRSCRWRRLHRPSGCGKPPAGLRILSSATCPATQ